MEPVHRQIVGNRWPTHFYSLDHFCYLKPNLNYIHINVHSSPVSPFQNVLDSGFPFIPPVNSYLCYPFFLPGSLGLELPHRFPWLTAPPLLTPVGSCHVPWLLPDSLLWAFPLGHNAFESWHGIMERAVESHGPELKSQHPNFTNGVTLGK